MQQSDYEIVGKFGFESRTHRWKNIKLAKSIFAGFFYIPIYYNGVVEI